MRIDMKFKLAVLFFFCSPSLHAGEHFSKFDDFTRETNNVFVTTEKEAESNRAYYVIGGYNKNLNTVSLLVHPLSGSTSCDKQYLLLKDSAGVIHKLDADERRGNQCFVRSIDADLIRKPFKVRIPMYSGADLDIEIDTTTLDLSKL